MNHNINVQQLSIFLSPKRLQHSLRTAQLASNLAKHYNVSIELAYLAGLLHDIAKDLHKKNFSKYFSANKIPYLKIYTNYFPIWQRRVGFMICRASQRKSRVKQGSSKTF